MERERQRAPLAAGASEQVRVILEAAEASAAQLRADADHEAREHVARVQAAADGMLARIDEIERELGSLLEALRESGQRLTASLAQLHEQVDVAAPSPVDEEDFAGAAPAAVDEPETAAVDEPEAADEPASKPAANGDDAGARLIALNMALDGKPREETARYLAEQFGLEDAGTLLDDVYARAGR